MTDTLTSQTTLPTVQSRPRGLLGAARTLIPPLWLILLLVIGNALARVYMSAEPVIGVGIMATLSLGTALIFTRTTRTMPIGLWGLVALAAAALISMWFAQDVPRGAVEVILWSSAVLIFWTATLMQVRQVERILFAILIAIALIAMYQIAWFIVEHQLVISEIPRPASITPNPNLTAHAMLIGICLAAWRRRWFWLGTFVIVLALSGARTSLLALAAGAVVFGTWLVFTRRLHISRRVLLIGGALALLVIPIIVIQFGHRTHGPLDFRIDLWQIALRTFADDPITGIGPEGYEFGFLQYKQVQHEKVHHHAHSVILQVAAETGIIGLSALTLLTVLIIRRIVQMYRGGDHERGVLAAALLVMMFVQGMIEYAYWVMTPILLVALAGWVITTSPAASPTPPTRREQVLTGAVIVGGLIAAILLPFTTFVPFLMALGIGGVLYYLSVTAN